MKLLNTSLSGWGNLISLRHISNAITLNDGVEKFMKPAHFEICQIYYYHLTTGILLLSVSILLLA